MIKNAQKSVMFTTFLKRLIYIRAGKKGNINIKRVLIVFINQNKDAIADKYVALDYPAQNLEPSLEEDCNTPEAKENNHICQNVIYFSDKKHINEIKESRIFTDSIKNEEAIFQMSKGIYDTEGNLVAFISFELDINFLEKLI